MTFFRVSYSSMYARYGPALVEADSELEAKRKFAGTAFRPEEFSLMTATEIPVREIARALGKAWAKARAEGEDEV